MITINGVIFETCDFRGESGKYPIPFANGMNRLPTRSQRGSIQWRKR